MSRSYRKPVCKLNNNIYFKKLYNKKLRLKANLSNNMFFKKCFCSWYICDFNTGLLTDKQIEKYYPNEKYKILKK